MILFPKLNCIVYEAETESSNLVYCVVKYNIQAFLLNHWKEYFAFSYNFYASLCLSPFRLL